MAGFNRSRQCLRQPQKFRLVVSHELFTQLDVLVGDIASARVLRPGRPLMSTGLHQMFAVERTINGVFALRAAADRANIAAYAWTIPARPPLTA
jgi:hypothetical protein